MDGGFVGGPWESFCERLRFRMQQLAIQAAQPEFRLPVGLFLVLDEQNGGDATAAELLKRLYLLDGESGTLVDFYYLGWHSVPPRRKGGENELRFSLSDFQSCRAALRNAGVREFGGNADLILVDAEYRKEHVWLHWDQAMILNLSALVKEGHIPSLGQFLQAIIATSETLREGAEKKGRVFQISDSLGLAYASESLLNLLLNTWGKAIGAKKLRQFATRKLGPTRTVRAL